MKVNNVKPLPEVETPKIPLRIITEVKPTKKSTKLSWVCKIIPRFGLIFGLDFSRKTLIPVTLVCALIWVCYWVPYGFLLKMNYLCTQKMYLIAPPECLSWYHNLNNILEATLGISSSLFLLLKRKSITQLLNVLMKVFGTDSDPETQILKSGMLARVVMLIVSLTGIIFCLGLPIGVVINYMYSVNNVISKLFNQSQSWGTFIICCNAPFLMMSTYFCLLYALICWVLKYNFDLLRKTAPSLSHGEFCQQEKRFEALLHLTESCFSQTLPVIYCLRAAIITVWICYFVFQINSLVAFMNIVPLISLFVLILIQSMLLLFPPISVNTIATMPIESPEPDDRKTINRSLAIWTPVIINFFTLFRLKSFDSSKSSPRLQLNRHRCFLTAGGIRISPWLIVWMVSVGVVLMAIRQKMQWLQNIFGQLPPNARGPPKNDLSDLFGAINNFAKNLDSQINGNAPAKSKTRNDNPLMNLFDADTDDDSDEFI